MSTETTPEGLLVLTGDERAAIRAFLQRCEVRLSTLHRVAAGMLSGAALMVLLPVVAKDSVTGVLRALVITELGPVTVALMVGIAAILAVPSVALWFLYSDLTRFYFQAHHLSGPQGETFTPRFTLTALELPSDELRPPVAAAMQRARLDPRMVELLVPINEGSRRRIDRQLAVYEGLGQGGTDQARADGLMALAASGDRALLEEAAKIEYGMARHILRLRVLVLRYVKALLALLTTALAVYTGDAVVAEVGPGETFSTGQQLWLAGVVLVWAPLVMVAVTTPIRWIEELMHDYSSTSTAAADDPEITLIERVTLRVATAGWLAAAVAVIVTLFDDGITGSLRVAGLGVLVITLGLAAIVAATGRLRSLI